MTETSIGYPDSPLNGPGDRHASLKPGDRYPPAPKTIPPGSGGRTLFRLVTSLSVEVERLAGRYKQLFELESSAEGGGADVLLIRPDGHVAAVSRDLLKIEDYPRAW